MLSNYTSVVYCFDRNYVDAAAVSTFSVFEKTKTPIKFYWICTNGYAALHAEFYRKPLLKLGIEIHIIPIKNSFDYMKEDLIVPHITKAAYFRILIPQYVSEERVIYLDCDVIANADIRELFEIDLKENSIAGCYNFYEPSENHIKPPIVNENVTYINSGVLVMDLNKLRNDNFIHKCAEIHNKNYDKILASDQCVINKYLENGKLLLERKWNFMVKGSKYSCDEFDNLLKSEDIRLLHFTDCSKPWDVMSRNKSMSKYWRSIADKMSILLMNAGSNIY